MQYKYIDLFSGCGGLSLGMHNASWRALFAVEKNEDAFKTLSFNLIEKDNHFVIQPQPGGHFSYAKTEYLSIYGKVVSSWKKENDKYIFEIEIPSNCSALIKLPNGKEENVKCGKHTFEV